MKKIFMEGEIKLSFYRAWRLLTLLKSNNLINAKGYLLDSETGNVVSKDEDPHYRQHRKRLTIPFYQYPEWFSAELLSKMKSGWLVYECDQDTIVCCVNQSIQFIKYKDLWDWAVKNNLLVLTRFYEDTIEEDDIRKLAFAFDFCKLKVVRDTFGRLNDEVYEEFVREAISLGLF